MSSNTDIVELYEKYAVEWDRQRRPRCKHYPFEKRWLDRFLRLLPPEPTILDVGCGMGEPIGTYLMSCGARLTGIDSSPSLIAMCRDRFADHQWIVEDMRTLDLGTQFDGVLAWHSFFHLSPEDQESMIARFAAHTKPGGALMFTSGWSRGHVIAEWQGEPLYHGSLDTEEYRDLLTQAGFRIVKHVVQDPTCGDATIWLAQMRPANGLDGSA
jgi:2-polyprenyl-3-methyl-5-hydroxy-6-metoxy-1,4-benzoquinol methylase